MRFSLLLASLLVSQLASAQYNFRSFKAGSYTLTTSPEVRQRAKLKLNSNTELIAEDATGYTTGFTPAQIFSFQIGPRKYVTAGGFVVKGGLDGKMVPQAFVELLDSGQVLAMRYKYWLSLPGPIPNSGTMETVYLLRRVNSSTTTCISGNRLSGGGPKFRESILPFLTERPDLAELVEKRKVALDHLSGIVRALNTGQPYTLAVPYYD